MAQTLEDFGDVRVPTSVRTMVHRTVALEHGGVTHRPEPASGAMPRSCTQRRRGRYPMWERLP